MPIRQPRCPICQHPMKPTFRSKATQYFRCSGCSCVYAPHVPTKTYSAYHRYEQYLQLRPYLINIFTRLVKKVAQYKAKGSVLEIGSSVGFLLETFRDHGFAVQGVEPSKQETKWANHHSIPTKLGYFEQQRFTKKYDVVVANHVLEHIPDPEPFFTKLKSVLKPNGIFVIQVPNFGSLDAQIWQGQWQHLIPDEHYWQFTPVTLPLLLKKYGFEVIDLTTVNSWTEFSSLSQYWRHIITTGNWKQLVYMLLELPKCILMSLMNLGGGLEVIAKKKN